LKFASAELAQTLRRRTATVTGAILIGLVALGFAYVSDEAQKLFAMFAGTAGWAVLIVTPAGFALLVWLTRKYIPEARGSGIPQVIAASQLPHPEQSPLLALKTAVAKLVLTVAGLLLGASSGREGPTVQVGAALMTAVHRLFRVPLSSAVIIAGGAAGVSAAFNTPLAGITFAIEELATAYEQRLTLLVMAAVVISGLVSLGIAGDYLYFGALSEGMTLAAGLITVPVVAIVCGAAGGLFSRAVLWVSDGTHALLGTMRRYPVQFAAGCGAVVALMGVLTGMTWGTGYEPARALIEGASQPWWFAPSKMLASLATAISGLPGGIFAPSLSVGAGLGGLLAPLFSVAPPATVVMVGMTAYFVGVVRAPLTSVVIIMEMTNSHGMLLALITAAILAEGVASLVCPERLYHGLARPFRRQPQDTAPVTPPAH
jgi:H+/Cl- antiporter ClcA